MFIKRSKKLLELTSLRLCFKGFLSSDYTERITLFLILPQKIPIYFTSENDVVFLLLWEKVYLSLKTAFFNYNKTRVISKQRKILFQTPNSWQFVFIKKS